LRSCKENHKITLIIAVALMFLSIFMYSSYNTIKNESKKYEYNIFESSQGIIRDISHISYGLYYELMNKGGNSRMPSEVFFKLNRDVDEIENIKKRFDEQVISYAENIDKKYSNLQYHILEKQNYSVLESSDSSINVLRSDYINDNEIEELNKKYDFYLVIDFNEDGKMQVKRVYGADKVKVMKLLDTSINEDMYGFNVDPRIAKIEPIKNMIFVYGIPKEVKNRDALFYYKWENECKAFMQVMEKYLTIALFFIVLIASILPYKVSKEIVSFKAILRVPIEAVLLPVFLILIFSYASDRYNLYENSLNGNLINSIFYGSILHSVFVDGNSNVNFILTSAINLVYWFIIFAVTFLAVVMVKYIMKNHIKTYLIEQSFSYKILRYSCRKSKRIYEYMSSIDLKDKSMKKLTIILGINFIVVSIISCFWFLGIILALIYTFIGFIMVKQYYTGISNNYNKLFEVTSKIAEGNLDFDMEEDLGIFNELNSELQGIQKGFKNAVDEEVKSQRMKNELITNVSHDLKTPLTSIITYVDLLKDEKINEEKRREYLDTLDRKAQRLKYLIEDLFEVSKATSGNVSLNIAQVDVTALVKQTLLELEDKIHKSEITIRTSFPEEKVILPLDSQRMFRVFENLIINITKYTLKGTRVYVEVYQSSDTVEINLKNIAAEEIDYKGDEILERFIRGDKARNTEGSGLGLAIAKSFVELQGGTLEVIVDGDLFKVVITFVK
jgi:signal transduction histidine kinase